MITDLTITPAGPGARREWVSDLLLLIGLLLAGVVLAYVWRGLDPHTLHLGSSDEVDAANDGTLILLGPVAGLLSGGIVLLWPGSAPLVRTVVAIVGSVLGALLTWKVGNLLGDPDLRAVASTFVWPFMTSVVLFLGALLPATSARLQPPPPPRPGPFGVGPHNGSPYSAGWGNRQVSGPPLPDRPAPYGPAPYSPGDGPPADGSKPPWSSPK